MVKDDLYSVDDYLFSQNIYCYFNWAVNIENEKYDEVDNYLEWVHDGDYLKIFDKNKKDKILWEGVIEFNQYNFNKGQSEIIYNGRKEYYLSNTVQFLNGHYVKGIPRKIEPFQWFYWFENNFPCEIIKSHTSVSRNKLKKETFNNAVKMNTPTSFDCKMKSNAIHINCFFDKENLINNSEKVSLLTMLKGKEYLFNIFDNKIYLVIFFKPNENQKKDASKINCFNMSNFEEVNISFIFRYAYNLYLKNFVANHLDTPEIFKKNTIANFNKIEFKINEELFKNLSNKKVFLANDNYCYCIKFNQSNKGFLVDFLFK